MKIVPSKFLLDQEEKNPQLAIGSSAVDRLNYLAIMVQYNWRRRKPGAGRKDLKEVVTVDVMNPKSNFRYDSEAFCAPTYVNISTVRHATAKISKRRDGEDPYPVIKAVGEPLPNKYAYAVLYSRDTLLNSGEELTDPEADWEIVALVVSPWKNALMCPITMARNYLRKPGGTFAPYTAEQFAESIYFWSQHFKSL